jgi:hypothetical protein
MIPYHPTLFSLPLEDHSKIYPLSTIPLDNQQLNKWGTIRQKGVRNIDFEGGKR